MRTTRSLTSCARVGLISSMALTIACSAPTAFAASTTGTATFDKGSCSGGQNTVDLSAKNPSPSQAVYVIHADGPKPPSPNLINVPANGSNGIKVTLPKGASKLTVEDSSGTIIGSTTVTCASSASSSSGQPSSASSSAAAAGGSSSTAAAAPTPASSDDASDANGGSTGSRKLLGYGVAGLGVLLAIGLLIREFR